MAAQHLDVGIHRAVLAVIIIVPDFLQDLLPAQGDALVADQKDQQVKLFGGEGRFLSGHFDGVAGGVDAQIPEKIPTLPAVAFGHGAAQHGLDAGYQFPRGKRLDHVIVSAAFQPARLTVTSGGKEIKSVKKRIMTPGEMEKTVIDLGDVTGDVVVRVEEG